MIKNLSRVVFIDSIKHTTKITQVERDVTVEYHIFL